MTLGSLGLAVVHDDKVLDWKFGLKGPDSLSVLRDDIAAAEAKGLFGLTAELSRQHVDSDERQQFVQEWERLRELSCLDDETVERRSTGQLVSTTCPASVPQR